MKRSHQSIKPLKKAFEYTPFCISVEDDSLRVPVFVFLYCSRTLCVGDVGKGQALYVQKANIVSLLSLNVLS